LFNADEGWPPAGAAQWIDDERSCRNEHDQSGSGKQEQKQSSPSLVFETHKVQLLNLH
jgi:hypothetical protein